MSRGKALVILALAFCIVTMVSGAPMAQEKAENPMVLMKTTAGNIKIELYPKEAPITVKNFLDYVDKKFYDGTVFHRVVPNFVIQGGGFTADNMRKSTNPPIKNEATNGLKNLAGTLSMARTSDINSATTQFFVNLKNNASLDHVEGNPANYGYAVFGKVVEGWDVVKKIAAAPNRAGGDAPEKPVLILSATRVETKPAAKSE